jgi:hypothetical protein
MASSFAFGQISSLAKRHDPFGGQAPYKTHLKKAAGPNVIRIDVS